MNQITREEIEEIEEWASAFFEDVSPSHDWHHVRRVRDLGKEIAKGEKADDEIVETGALLHDIGRQKEFEGEIDDHADWGAEKGRRFLADLGLDEGFIDEVEHCIRSHRYSNDIEPCSVEAKVLCDADNLDALGAVGIARCFAFGGEIGSKIHDPYVSAEDDSVRKSETQINHMKKKIIGLEDRMYTSTGEKIAEERQSFVEEFVERFEEEVNVNSESLT